MPVKPFEKGKSGNPNGRPKNPSFREWVDKEHPELLTAFYKSLAHGLKTKNARITTWFGDQYNGKAPQPIVGDNGSPITVRIIKDLED